VCGMLAFLPAGLQLPGPHIGLVRAAPPCNKQHLQVGAKFAVSSSKIARKLQ